MREIEFKFVGRNKKFNEIVISESLTITDILSESYPVFFHLANRTAGGNCEFIAEIQYTGLKDKNGKKIFEGDIIKNNGIIEQIFWSNGAFWSSHSADHKERGRAFCNRGTPYDIPHEVEIIGNIYENPRLLEGIND